MSWPGFSELTNAWWLLLLIPLIVFYFLKLKRPRVEISSLVLWQSVIDDQRVNSPFQKFRRNILLWLQAVILVTVVAASMQPFVQGSAKQAEYQPIMIDCSASMAATDPFTGKSRLDLAKEQVTRLIDNLTGNQKLALISVHSSADQLTEFTANRRLLQNALAELRVRDVPSDLTNGLRLTQALARTVPVDSVILQSDGNVPNRVQFALPFRVNYQQLSKAGPNAGITAFNARLASSQTWEVFLRVESSDDCSGQVELLQDGQQVGEQPFALGPDESQQLTFHLDALTSTQLEARLTFSTASFDSLTADNTAWLAIPAARPLRVYVPEDLKSFRRALPPMPEVDLFPKKGQPIQRSIPYDLVISDQPTDEDLLAPVCLMVGVTPEETESLVESSSTLTRFLDWNRAAPLLRHMQLRDVEIAEAVRTISNVNDGNFEEVGYSVLASGLEGPLVLRHRSSTRLAFHTLFDTRRSTFEFRVAFPIFVANLVQIARQEANVDEVAAARTGVLPVLTLNANSRYTVTAPDRSLQELQTDTDGQLRGATAHLAGKYRFTGSSTEPFEVSANLLSSAETTLDAVDSIQFDEQSVSAAEVILKSNRPLWQIFTLLALGILLVEWWIFQQPRPNSPTKRPALHSR